MLHSFLRLVMLGSMTALSLLLAPFGSVIASTQTPTHPLSTTATNISVFATGLNNPRGLSFGPDGNLYVAEGGRGGTHSTVGQCTQVPAPVGPYTGGMTARISKINTSGERSTVVDNLPSNQTSPKIGSEVSGVGDVAFIGHTLYGLLAGAGCSHGVPQVPNGIIRVNGNSWKLIANLSHFIMTHPVKNPEAADFEPDGTWYSMVQANNHFYAVEPNHGELDSIATDGAIQRIADISASMGHIVPTAVALHNGNFYVGNLNTFPIKQGSAKILKITPDGQISTFATGLTTVVSIAFDTKGRLYALELSVGKPMPAPNTGALVRITNSGKLETIASGLSIPTGMTIGPDGKIYVSAFGSDFKPGMGQILRINPS